MSFRIFIHQNCTEAIEQMCLAAKELHPDDPLLLSESFRLLCPKEIYRDQYRSEQPTSSSHILIYCWIFFVYSQNSQNSPRNLLVQFAQCGARHYLKRFGPIGVTCRLATPVPFFLTALMRLINKLCAVYLETIVVMCNGIIIFSIDATLRIFNCVSVVCRLRHQSMFLRSLTLFTLESGLREYVKIHWKSTSRCVL